jgi:hypothetical protein
VESISCDWGSRSVKHLHKFPTLTSIENQKTQTKNYFKR